MQSAIHCTLNRTVTWSDGQVVRWSGGHVVPSRLCVVVGVAAARLRAIVRLAPSSNCPGEAAAAAAVAWRDTSEVKGRQREFLCETPSPTLAPRHSSGGYRECGGNCYRVGWLSLSLLAVELQHGCQYALKKRSDNDLTALWWDTLLPVWTYRKVF